VGRRSELTLDHLMASSAIPLLFPPMRLGDQFFGDGAMRQLHPLSPAIHLGADRLLIIGVRQRRAAGVSISRLHTSMPSPGEIFGYMLDTLFMDSIYGDLERLQRINETVSHIHDSPTRLKVIETLVVVPSEDIRDIAHRHKQEFPRSVRLLLRGMGGLRRSGSQLLSYLLFESGYCRELVALGYKDAMAQGDKLLRFMDVEPASDQDRIAS
ncbi:MAG: patatin-like phospholipase family protein, partial [Gammaproteobacteria bacterium]